MKILGAIGHVIRVSEPKTEMPVGGLNSSSSKTNFSRRILVLNLEAAGNVVQLPNLNYHDSDTCFLLSLFI